MAELFHELGIEPRLLAVNVAAFLLVLFLLAKYFFRPFGLFLKERAEHIEAQVTEAEKARRDAEAQVEAVRREQEEMRERLAAEAEAYRREARQEAQRITAEASRSARERLQRAEEDLERQRQKLREELRAETAGLASLIARKALTLSLGAEERQESVEAAIRRVEELAKESRN